MKAITTNHIEAHSQSEKSMAIGILNIGKGVIMNLISNIMIKDYDMKKDSMDIKKMKANQGLSIYKALEFSKEQSNTQSQNPYFEMICNKII